MANNSMMESLPEFFLVMEKAGMEISGLSKSKNITKLHTILNKALIFSGKCSNKHEMNYFTKLLISIFQKVQQEYFTIIESQTGETEEIDIEIGGSTKDEKSTKNAEYLLILCNKIMEIFLGVIKFSEKFDQGLLAKGILNQKEKVFCLNIEHNIRKETALEICNTIFNFFEVQRKSFIFNFVLQKKISFSDRKIIQDSFLLSFLIISTISSNINHTYTMDVENELIFFLINYIMNRNIEFYDYFILEFSKKYKIDRSEIQNDISKQELDKEPQNQKEYPAFNIFEGIYDRGLSILQMKTFVFQSFFREQFIRNAKAPLIKEIIMKKNSHYFVLNMGQFLIYRIFSQNEIAQVFLKVFNMEDISATTAIFNEMFSIDKNSAEKLLKELIIVKKAVIYKDLFFERCKKLDSAYIDCLSICDSQISTIPFDIVEKIIDSHYLVFLVESPSIFKQFLLKISDFLSYKLLGDSTFNEGQFFKNLIDRLLIKRYESCKKRNMLLKHGSKPIEHVGSTSLSSLSSTISLQNQNYMLDITLEMMQKSIMFLEVFPSAMEDILPFLKMLLSRFNRKSQSKKNDKDIDEVYSNEDILNPIPSSGSLRSDGSKTTPSEIFLERNAEVITKILNLTRSHVRDWNLSGLLRRLNPISLMKNNIFTDELELDALFFHSLDEIIKIIVENGIEKRDIEGKQNFQDEEKNAHNEQIISILISELRKIFSSENNFQIFIILKMLDFSKLMENPDFMVISRSYAQMIFPTENNDFYNEFNQNPDKTCLSSSQTTNNRTILQHKPLEDIHDTSFNEMNSSSQCSLITPTEKDNTISDDTTSLRNVKTDTDHMRLSEIDESFSLVSLKSTAESKKKPVLYSHEHFYIDLMSDLMKVDFLKKNTKNMNSEDLMDHCKSRLMFNYDYKSGLFFYSSKVSFTTKKSNFSLFCNFYQYQLGYNQFIVRFFTKDGGYFGIKINDKNLIFLNFENNSEIVLLNDHITENKIETAFEFNSKILLCYINDEKYTFNVGRVKKIEIGDGFKGIIDKILFFENEKFDQQYKRSNISVEDFYNKFLQGLEKRCGFYNHFGFIMFKEIPFFLSCRRRDIEVKNVYRIDHFDISKVKK